MASHRRPVRVSYDDLYWFFARELNGGEFSSLELDHENPGLRWTTQVETNCGMYLFRPPLYRECVYRRSPLNSVEFARTGGDGIHYSFLVLDGHWSELSPVVLTDPCGETSNVVLGENLTEFLRLGIRRGYFALSYLVDEDGSIRAPARIEELEAKEFPEDVEPETAKALRLLADRYGLEPLEGVADRLVELQRRYQPLLRQAPPRCSFVETTALATERLLARFRPGDAVIWERGAGVGLVKATVIAVTAKRVTITAEDPDQTGAGVVTRHVNTLSLRLQPRGPTGQAPPRPVSGQGRRRDEAPRRPGGVSLS